MKVLGLDLERLIRIVETSEISFLEVEGISGRVKIVKPEGAEVISCYLPRFPEKKKIDKEKRKMKYQNIASPGVGRFYLVDPRVQKAQPYVKKGSRIKKGDIVGLIKHLNFYDEIRANCDGRIREIYVHNNDPVDYNMPLMKVRIKS